MAKELNENIYIYEIVNGKIVYERTVARISVRRAKQRVEELEAQGKEAFYTIGTTLGNYDAFY